MKWSHIASVASASLLVHGAAAKSCGDRTSRSQCRNGDGCDWLAEWNACLNDADASALIPGYEPGKTGTIYKGDPCAGFGKAPKKCKESSLCTYDITDGSCEFLPVGQRFSKRGSESFTHEKISDFGLSNDINDMSCGEAFTSNDCATLNDKKSMKTVDSRGHCQWSCVVGGSGLMVDVCHDVDHGGHHCPPVPADYMEGTECKGPGVSEGLRTAQWPFMTGGYQSTADFLPVLMEGLPAFKDFFGGEEGAAYLSEVGVGFLKFGCYQDPRYGPDSVGFMALLSDSPNDAGSTSEELPLMMISNGHKDFHHACVTDGTNVHTVAPTLVEQLAEAYSGEESPVAQEDFVFIKKWKFLNTRPKNLPRDVAYSTYWDVCMSVGGPMTVDQNFLDDFAGITTAPEDRGYITV